MIGLIIGFLIPYILAVSTFYFITDIIYSDQKNIFYLKLKESIIESVKYRSVFYSAVSLAFAGYLVEFLIDLIINH